MVDRDQTRRPRRWRSNGEEVVPARDYDALLSELEQAREAISWECERADDAEARLANVQAELEQAERHKERRLSDWQAEVAELRARLAKVQAELEQADERYNTLHSKLLDERDAAEARLAKVPALVEALRLALDHPDAIDAREDALNALAVWEQE